MCIVVNKVFQQKSLSFRLFPPIVVKSKAGIYLLYSILIKESKRLLLFFQTHHMMRSIIVKEKIVT